MPIEIAPPHAPGSFPSSSSASQPAVPVDAAATTRATDALALPAAPLSSLRAVPPAAEVAAPRVRTVELAALAGLVGLADLSLFWGSGGAGDAVLLVAAAAILFAASPTRRLSGRLWIMLALVGALAARSVWHGSAGTLLLGMSGLFAVALALRTRRAWVPEAFVSWLASAVGCFQQLWDYLAGAFRLVTRGRLRSVRWATILVPTLVVTLFALVFLAANPLLERWAGLAWDALTSGSGTFFSPARAGFWLVAALVAAGLLAPRVRELRVAERLGPGHRIEGEIEAPQDSTVALARNLFIGVNALFLVYNALDAVYLWAGTPPPGVDHTRYAHDGTAWLTISLLMSTVVLGIVFRGGMNARTVETRQVRTLALVWAVQNIVLAAGTFRRIQMYVADSGLTELRCFGIAGVVVVAAAFGLIMKKVYSRHTALWLLRSQFDVFVLALVVWTVLPIDRLVWSFNVARIEAGEGRPLLHLFKQGVSAEGVEPLAALLEHSDPIVARGVASRLLSIRSGLEGEEREARRWTQTEVSRSRALTRLDADMPAILALIPDNASSVAAFEALRDQAYAANGSAVEYDRPWHF